MKSDTPTSISEFIAVRDSTNLTIIPTAILSIAAASKTEALWFSELARQFDFTIRERESDLIIYKTGTHDSNYKIQSLWLFLFALKATSLPKTKFKMDIQEINNFYHSMEDAIKQRDISFDDYILRSHSHYSNFLSVDNATSLYLHQAGFPITPNEQHGVSFSQDEAMVILKKIQKENSQFFDRKAAGES